MSGPETNKNKTESGSEKPIGAPKAAKDKASLMTAKKIELYKFGQMEAERAKNEAKESYSQFMQIYDGMSIVGAFSLNPKNADDILLNGPKITGNNVFLEKFKAYLNQKADTDIENAVSFLKQYVPKIDKALFLNTVPSVMNFWAINEVNKQIQAKYKYLYEFPQYQNGQCSLNFSINVVNQGIQVSALNLTGFEKEYKEFHALKAKEDKEQTKGKLTEEEIEKKVDEAVIKMKEHKVGKSLIALFSEEGMKDMLRSYHKGEGKIMAFFLGLLGVPGFVVAYKGVKEGIVGLYPKAKDKLAKLEEWGKGVAKKVGNIGSESLIGKLTDIVEIENAGQFNNVLKDVALLDSNILLKKEYKFGEKPNSEFLSVDLTNGGIILPASKVSKLKIGSKIVSQKADEEIEISGDTFGDSILKLEGVIPKGTVFKKGTVFLKDKEPAA